MKNIAHAPTIHKLRIKEADFKDIVEHPREVYILSKPTQINPIDGDYLLLSTVKEKTIRQIIFAGEETLSLVRCKIKLEGK